MKDLPRRTLTAIIFGAIMLGGLLWNRISFSILILIIQSGCLYEYLMLVRTLQNYPEKKKRLVLIVTIVLCSAVLIAMILEQSDTLSIIYAVLLIPVCFLLLAAELFYQSETPLINGLLNVGAVIYISSPMIFFYSLADDRWLDSNSRIPKAIDIAIGVVLIIWTSDTFAYFTGSLTGKHKILPAISPKKSWEGFFGGLIFALITSWILSLYFTKLNLQQWMIVAVIIVVFGSIGDFFESMIKRQAGVKDSGNLLPGHGGFLDRFDALLFCLPFVTMYLLLSS